MSTIERASMIFCLVLFTLLGIRTLTHAHDDDGRLAGATIVSLTLAGLAWIVATS